MKLGIINDWTEAGFAHTAGMGLSFLEFCVNHNCDAAEFASKTDDITAWSKKYGVAVGSIGRWGETRVLPDGSYSPESRKSDLLLIDAASKLGCPVYNCGVNYVQGRSAEENIEQAVSILSELVAYGKARGVKMAVYNCSWGNFIYGPKTWPVVLPRVDGLGIKYDPSHCIGRDCDYLEELRDFGQYVYHFHVKGFIKIAGKEYDNPPAGHDQVMWGAVMDMLYTKKYKGGLSIEPHSSKWRGERGQWGVEFTVKYMKQFLMPDYLDDK